MIRALSIALLLGAASPALSGEFISISDADAAAIRAGEEFGDIAELAAAAGLPSPHRVLALADQLELAEDQRRQVAFAVADVEKEAKELGGAYLAAERALEDMFASGRARAGKVKQLTETIAELRGKLRFVHLRARLSMRPVLTAEQREAYARLTGAADG